MRPRMLGWCAALGATAWLVWADPEPTVVQAASAPSARAAAVTASAAGTLRPAAPSPAQPALRSLVQRDTLIPAGDDGSAASAPPRSQLFGARAWADPPAAAAASEPSVPTAPAFPYTLVGRRQAGDAWQVFLLRDDAPVAVQVGDALGTDYRVTHIDAQTLQVVYIPLNHLHTLALDALGGVE